MYIQFFNNFNNFFSEETEPIAKKGADDRDADFEAPAVSVTVRPPLGKCHVTTMPFMPYSLTVSIMLSAPSLQGVLEGEGKEWGMGLSFVSFHLKFSNTWESRIARCCCCCWCCCFFKEHLKLLEPSVPHVPGLFILCLKCACVLHRSIKT